MPDLQAFGLNDSDLNPFLFARVGTELNGSELTILSLLARLGSDPWTEAGRLATLPRAAATDWLAERISAMPLTLDDVDGPHPTAARVVLLLPPRTAFDSVMANTRGGVKAGAMINARGRSAWAAFALILGLLTLVIMFSMTHGAVPSADPTGIHDR